MLKLENNYEHWVNFCSKRFFCLAVITDAENHSMSPINVKTETMIFRAPEFHECHYQCDQGPLIRTA